MKRGRVKAKRRLDAPVLGSGILCNSVNVTGAGRVNIQGVITIFWAWGYPCARTWFVLLTLFHLPKGKFSIVIAVRKRGGRESTTLAVVDAVAEKNDTITTVPVQLNHLFDSPGPHELVCTLKGARQSLRVPFIVSEREWVAFSKEEKEHVKQNPKSLRQLRANVHCKKCQCAYIFEESVIDEPPTGGVHRFPASGEFKCEACGHLLRLKDVQGQLRASLKEMVGNAIKGKDS